MRFNNDNIFVLVLRKSQLFSVQPKSKAEIKRDRDKGIAKYTGEP